MSLFSRPGVLPAPCCLVQSSLPRLSLSLPGTGRAIAAGSRAGGTRPPRGLPSSTVRPSATFRARGTSWLFGRVCAPRAAELVPSLWAGLGAPAPSALAGPVHWSGARAVPPGALLSHLPCPCCSLALLPPHTSSPWVSRAASIAGAATATGRLQPRVSGLPDPPAKRGQGWQRGKNAPKPVNQVALSLTNSGLVSYH